MVKTGDLRLPTAAARARVASRAQAQAHRELREAHPVEYQLAYQEAKAELTEQELTRTE